MEGKTDHYQTLLRAFLPEEIFDYFEIVRIDTYEDSMDVFLDELNHPPKEFEKDILISKGFHDTVCIQDFPIRRKAVYLHVRRRKWYHKASGKIVSNSWDLTSKGTRYTKDFATFLKGLLG
jgi:hypothetical protein